MVLVLAEGLEGSVALPASIPTWCVPDPTKGLKSSIVL